MAFSLLNHIKQSKSKEISSLLPALDAVKKSHVIAFSLAHLVYLNRKDPAQNYQAIRDQNLDFFWQDVDTAQLTAQAEQASGIAIDDLRAFTNQIIAYIYADIIEIDDAASLEQDGVSELIEGQLEHLSAEAPDWLWAAARLDELQGQVAETEQPIDLETSIASLSKMIHQAATTTHTDDPIDHEIDGDDHSSPHASHHIELPPQRDAPAFFKVLEPLVAFLILISLLCWFLGYNT